MNLKVFNFQPEIYTLYDRTGFLPPGHGHGRGDLIDLEFGEGFILEKENKKVTVKNRGSQNSLSSIPSPGMCKVKNIYINPSTGKCVIEYDDIPEP
jgi:hypothetical protein